MLVTPGDTQYLSLWILASWTENGARHIEVEMLQERVAWRRGGRSRSASITEDASWIRFLISTCSSIRPSMTENLSDDVFGRVEGPMVAADQIY